MGIDGSGVAIIVEVPNGGENLLPGQRDILILRHIKQQLKFSGGQRDLLTVYRDRMGVGVNTDAGNLHLGAQSNRALEKRLDPGDENGKFDGLGNILIRAADKAHDLAVFIAFGGEHDNGNLTEAANGLACLNAIHHRHHNIQNCHGDVAVLTNQLNSLLTVGGFDGFKALVPEEIAYQTAPTLFIVGNQDFYIVVHASFASLYIASHRQMGVPMP